MKNIVNKRWGTFEVINEGKKYTVKKLIVHPSGQLSLQSHEGRSEHWLVAQGKAEVIINDKTYNLIENQHIFIPQGAKHRLANRGDQTLVVIEMWFGDLLDENDIKRYED
tara:strand:+ start:18 stop:347 length:330 start_codon:yes stop_codon:yes gene_type:complete